MPYASQLSHCLYIHRSRNTDFAQMVPIGRPTSISEMMTEPNVYLPVRSCYLEFTCYRCVLCNSKNTSLVLPSCITLSRLTSKTCTRTPTYANCIPL